jgi:hypothetical protein
MVNLFMAERVGFEPTCLALHETNRFRVDPVTTTSVPLRTLSPILEKILYDTLAFLFHNAGNDLEFMIHLPIIG